MSSSWKPFLLGLALMACAPRTEPPVSVMAVDLTSPGVYGPKEVSLNTVRDISALKGAAANFVGGARIEIDPGDPLLQGATFPTQAQLREIFLKQRGADVRVNYADHEGVLWPVDFHSWNMVSAYLNFERAYTYFNDLGILDPEDISNPLVYYFPRYIDATVSAAPQNDNTLYDSRMQAFIILPFDQFQAVPLAMNRGAVAHEFSHFVFNRRVYEGQSFPFALQSWQDAASGSFQGSFKILKALDEGLADFHAAESLCAEPDDPACGDMLFLEPSLGAAMAQARNIQSERCLNQTLLTGLTASGFANDTFLLLGRHYEVGTIIASSFWIPAENRHQHGVVQRAIVAAYNDPNPDENLEGLAQLINADLGSPELFTLGKALDRIVSHLPAGLLKDEICGHLIERLRLTADGDDRPPSCAPSAAPPGVCEPL